MMTSLRTLALAFLLAVVAACDSKTSPFQKVDGAWHFNKTAIPDADAATFTPIDAHYAKDRARGWYADTYRDGKEYFTIKHDRILVLGAADAASFHGLGRDYARDARGVYHEGKPIPVKDPASFEILDYGFARDKRAGYCYQTEVAGSDGATFAVIDSHYAKDGQGVVYCTVALDGPQGPYVKVKRLPGALPASFAALDAGYAKDAGQVYFRDEPVKGADAASFRTLEKPSEGADAQDAGARYLEGRALRATAP